MPTFKHLMICFQFLMYLVLSNSNLLKTIGTYMISAISLGYTCLVRFFFLRSMCHATAGSKSLLQSIGGKRKHFKKKEYKEIQY